MAFQGDAVNVFTLDPSIGEFILSQPALRIPASPQRIYSINEGNLSTCPSSTQRFVAECKAAAKPYSLRCACRARATALLRPQRLTAATPLPTADTGSMVADVHRTLLYGGVFMYPATTSAPKGKLRVLYECHPMAFLIEQAGGLAITGLPDSTASVSRLLDLVPTSIHDRSGVIMGCTRDVARIMEISGGEGEGAAA